MDNNTDPFNQPPAAPNNSAGTNPNNQFANAGWGKTDDNDYLGNYGGSATCQSQKPVLEYTLRRDVASGIYRVFMRPTITPVQNISMTGQITLKVPHGLEGGRFVTTGVQTLFSGVNWTQTSRSDAPLEDSAADYLSFSFTPGGTTAFPWVAGQELEIFNFRNANESGCKGSVSIMDNNDPFNSIPNSRQSNPGNQFNNVGWDGLTVNHYKGNYGSSVSCAPASVRLQAKALLQAAYESYTGLMVARLGTKLPTSQPYYASPFAYSGAENLSASVRGLVGADAPVDWMLLDLRAATDATSILATKALIIQRDGDLVDATTGDSILQFAGILPGSYYIGIRHRNHLGIMLKNPVILSGTPVVVDFTLPTTVTYGLSARLEGIHNAVLWGGDAGMNNDLIANGPGNDGNALLGKILSSPDNIEFNSNFRLEGYLPTDLNMDGVTLYSGPGNDLNMLLGNVLLNPNNGLFAANFIVSGNLPKKSMVAK